ncbi:PREDICTED: uncharacterized protein LOC106807642 [Priapulus caudatus]|uniref:Uncharacterized protein LOC106807642 n=1 Tax=Priapulus caudatus TaxID=37621 RepID=A0ABM1E018_PRICU|nr:PREDICTED: uncharacterized protein LOC106807642 [Priapulus caudatus]
MKVRAVSTISDTVAISICDISFTAGINIAYLPPRDAMIYTYTETTSELGSGNSEVVVELTRITNTENYPSRTDFHPEFNIISGTVSVVAGFPVPFVLTEPASHSMNMDKGQVVPIQFDIRLSRVEKLSVPGRITHRATTGYHHFICQLATNKDGEIRAGIPDERSTISGIIDMATIALGTCANFGDASVAYTNGENNVEIKLAFKLAKDSDLDTISKVSAGMQYSAMDPWVGLMPFTTVDTYTPGEINGSTYSVSPVDPPLTTPLVRVFYRVKLPRGFRTHAAVEITASTDMSICDIKLITVSKNYPCLDELLAAPPPLTTTLSADLLRIKKARYELGYLMNGGGIYAPYNSDVLIDDDDLLVFEVTGMLQSGYGSSETITGSLITSSATLALPTHNVGAAAATAMGGAAISVLSFTDVASGGATGIVGIGGIASMELKLDVPANSIHGVVIDLSVTEQSLLDFCGIRTITIGDNIPCVKEELFREHQDIVMSSGSTTYDQLTVNVGLVCNTGLLTEPVQNQILIKACFKCR